MHKMLKLYTWCKTTAEDLKQKLNQEEGQTIIEYALIIVLIVLVALATAPTIGSAIANVFSRVIASLTTGS
jgi:Flp pilus assembly pilin Flp